MIFLKNFNNLNFKERFAVLKWRNHSKVRKWMYNDKPISYKEHKEFIKTLSYPYFLVKENNKAIGVINIKKNSIGLFTNPYIKGKGKILLKIIIENFMRSKLFAEVFYNNKKAIRLYEKFGFKQVGKKRVSHKRIIVMEKIK